MSVSALSGSRRHRRWNTTTLLSSGFVAVILGVALSRVYQLTVPLPILLVLGVWAVFGIKSRSFFGLLIVSVFGLLLGVVRGTAYSPQIAPYAQLEHQKVVVRAVADSSAVYGSGAQMEFDAGSIEILSPYYVKMPGKMVLSGYGVNSVLRGDVVEVSGKLHLRRGGKQAGISYGKLQVISRSASWIEGLRRRFLTGMRTALPEPHAQFAAGLLIGQKNELPDDVTKTLQIVGLSHIIAVSGYNLTIMVDVAKRRGASKFRTTVMGIALILVFVLITGTSASISRAAFVSILSLVASYFGRQLKPMVVVSFAAAVTALMLPLNIWSDIGWYLSFLAFFGVLIVAPAVQKRLYHDKEPGMVPKLLIETISAQLMTVPLGMYIFGEISLISLLANLLVVPFVPIAMLLSFFAGIAGMVMPLRAGVFAWPAKVLLQVILGVCGVLSRVPHALSPLKITTSVLVLLYGSVVASIIIMQRRSAKYGKIGAK